MKNLEKYFLAIVPPVEILGQVTAIKEDLQQKFGIKYALKSPPHVTLKMPFSYNETKEELLAGRIGDFLQMQASFPLGIIGVGTFGNRVIFLDIVQSEELKILQSALKSFCKKDLNLIEELSDRNYHPHMTVAFKDLKSALFREVLEVVKSHSFSARFQVTQLSLLKRSEGRWRVHRQIGFGGIEADKLGV
jgi:2'-5' RNA ligase